MTESDQPRNRAIALTFERARESGRRVFGYDDTGRTTRLVAVAMKKMSKYAEVISGTIKAVCVEGDPSWTQLCSWTPTSVQKLRDKRTRVRKAQKLREKRLAARSAAAF